MLRHTRALFAGSLAATVALAGCSSSRQTYMPIQQRYEISYQSSAQQRVLSEAIEAALVNLETNHPSEINSLTGQTIYVTGAGLHAEDYKNKSIQSYVLGRIKGVLGKHGAIVLDLDEDLNMRTMMDEDAPAPPAPTRKPAAPGVKESAEPTTIRDTSTEKLVEELRRRDGRSYAYPDADFIAQVSIGGAGADLMYENNGFFRKAVDFVLDVALIGFLIPDFHKSEMTYDGNCTIHLSAVPHKRGLPPGFDIRGEGHYLQTFDSDSIAFRAAGANQGSAVNWAPGK